jgi:hypothetical protein
VRFADLSFRYRLLSLIPTEPISRTKLPAADIDCVAHVHPGRSAARLLSGDLGQNVEAYITVHNSNLASGQLENTRENTCTAP